MNKHNNEYIVLFGNDRYAADRYAKSAKNRFDYLDKAKEFASAYENSYVFKVHYDPQSGDVAYVQNTTVFM